MNSKILSNTIILSALLLVTSLHAQAADLSVQVLDQAGNPLSNAVVYLETSVKSAVKSTTEANVDQKNKQAYALHQFF